MFGLCYNKNIKLSGGVIVGYKIVKYINKEYSIPEDLLVYINLLDITEQIKADIYRDFIRKLSCAESACVGNEQMQSQIELQVSKFITKLTEQGVYDRTINDYIKENEGYKLISKVNEDALNEAKRLLMNEMTEFQEGYESALYKKDASVTGMGFSIWSGSFVNHAIYAAMEASTLHKQEQAASKEYQKDIDELSARIEHKKNQSQKSYITNIYQPNMEVAITVFSYELLDLFISDLIKNGKLDKEILCYIDIGRSNDLLNNLKLSANKEEVLYKAFEICPYNAAVYMGAMRYDLLDFDTFQTARLFKQDNVILSFLESNWGEVTYPKKFDIDYHCIDLLALYLNKTSKEVLKSYTTKYVDDIFKAYSQIANMLSDNKQCRKIIRDLTDTTILQGDIISKGTAQAKVNSIVMTNIWSQLVSNCGHSDLLDRIKTLVPDDVQINTKTDIDNYFIDKLTDSFEKARQNIAEEIVAKKAADEEYRLEKEKQRAEQERIRLEKKAKRITFAKKSAKRILVATGGIVVLFIAFFIGVAIFLTVTNKPIDNDFSQKYTDNLHGLSYSVPECWVLDSEQSYEQMKYYVRYDNWDEFMCVLGIKYVGDIPETSVVDVVSQYTSTYGSDADTKSKNIGEQEFTVVTYVDEKDDSKYFYNVYVTEQNSSVFFIYFMSKENNNNVELFEEIVAAVDFAEYKNPKKESHNSNNLLTFSDGIVFIENNEEIYSKYNNNIWDVIKGENGEGSSWWFWIEDDDAVDIHDGLGEIKTNRGIVMGVSSEKDIINAYGHDIEIMFDPNTDIVYNSMKDNEIESYKYLEDSKKVFAYDYNAQYQIIIYTDKDDIVDFILFSDGLWYEN